MRVFGAVAAICLALVACGNGDSGTPDKLTLLTHNSFAAGVDDETFAAFTAETGIEVDVKAAGDAGSLVNQAILTKDNPLGDVLFGVDDTFLSRALDNGIFAQYTSGLIGEVPEELVVDQSERVTPIDFGDVCINYDKAAFEAGTPLPATLDEVSEPQYAARLTVQHPATSSPGLAFMLATVAEFGEDGWLDFWRDLKQAGTRVAPDWDTAYYGDFTRYGGSSSMVVSYASSPPAEVLFADPPVDQAPTGVIHAGCYRQIEFAGILSGTDHLESAGRLIDFMLSVEFQQQIPLKWFVFPANSNAPLPDEFIAYTILPESPARLDPRQIAENRDRWISEWANVMEG